MVSAAVEARLYMLVELFVNAVVETHLHGFFFGFDYIYIYHIYMYISPELSASSLSLSASVALVIGIIGSIFPRLPPLLS